MLRKWFQLVEVTWLFRLKTFILVMMAFAAHLCAFYLSDWYLVNY